MAPIGDKTEILPLSVETVPQSTELDAAPESATQHPVTITETGFHYKSPGLFRRSIEHFAIFLITILFLRVIAVEPYGVPTGSMAPSLIGNHFVKACPRCHYPVVLGQSEPVGGHPTGFCPNCGKSNIDMQEVRTVPGDRVLVDKTIYHLRHPRRWEIAVFMNPSDLSKPYVKRVIGLPGEKLLIKNGDIWVNGELIRKSFSEVQECMIPIFDADFCPPGGWYRRWYSENQEPSFNATATVAPPEWLKIYHKELAIHAKDSTLPRLAGYWQTSIDQNHVEVLKDQFSYNGDPTGNSHYAIHEFILSFEAQFQGSGELIAGINDGANQVRVALSTNDQANVGKFLVDQKLVSTFPHQTLGNDGKVMVELSFVDRRLIVAINGRPCFTHDLPVATSFQDVRSPCVVGARGIDTHFRNIRIYRDIYYRPTGQHAVQKELPIAQNHYYLLGDNSANSDDSRSWKIPTVPERNFLGKPFFLHQPSKANGWGGIKSTRGFQIDWQRVRLLR
ncbi:MAG: signal peptidase I [Zavarzinella sp.]